MLLGKCHILSESAKKAASSFQSWGEKLLIVLYVSFSERLSTLITFPLFPDGASGIYPAGQKQQQKIHIFSSLGNAFCDHDSRYDFTVFFCLGSFSKSLYFLSVAAGEGPSRPSREGLAVTLVTSKKDGNWGVKQN